MVQSVSNNKKTQFIQNIQRRNCADCWMATSIRELRYCGTCGIITCPGCHTPEIIWSNGLEETCVKVTCHACKEGE